MRKNEEREWFRKLVARAVDGDLEAVREMQAEYGGYSGLSGDVVAALVRLAESIHRTRSPEVERE